MENITLEHGGKTFTFSVKFEEDDNREPWKEGDGHGPVSDWTQRDKLPGELVLNTDHGSKRFYDYTEACKIALRDGWNAAPYPTTPETKRQQAARAAMADYEYLREWCADQWRYVGVIVTLLDDDGEETNVCESLWGVEDRNNYHHTTAKELAEGLAEGYGSTWGLVTKETFGYLQSETN